MINILSNLAIPLMVLLVIIYGICKKDDIYDSFVDGAKESVSIALSMFPCLLAMILGINIFINSGFLDFMLNFIKPVFDYLKIPLQIMPMALMRPISGSASLAILNNILGDFGPDSLIGKIASSIQGSTDTTFYVLTLYFGSIGVKKIRYALKVGLLADLIGIVTSIVIVKLLF